MTQPPLESSVDIDATPDAVWAAVTDLKAMARRSPELVGMWLLGKPKAGRLSINLNRRKGFMWPTTARITRWKPPSNDNGRGAFVFRVWPTNVDWSYEIEPTATGTHLVERRSAHVDPSATVRLTAKLALGGADNHDTELSDGMDKTVAAIKTDLEHPVR